MRALYIEDEPLARWTGKQIIEGLGLDVTVAENCAQARELWEKNSFDIVISDYRLPDGLASGFIGEMRAAGCKEPVVCLSGEPEDISQEQAEELALAAVLRKPLDSAGLEDIIASLSGNADEDDASPAELKADADTVEGNGAANIHVGRIPPFWISPFWSLKAAGPGAWRDIEIAPGQGTDVWALLANCSDAGCKGAGLWKKLCAAFVQIARWMPDTGLPAETLNRCRQALILDIAHDFSVSMLVLCLRNGHILFAGDSAGRWSVFYEKIGAGWRRLETSGNFAGEKETGAVLVADNDFPGLGNRHDQDDLEELISNAFTNSGGNSNIFLLKPEDMCRSFLFSAGTCRAELLEERLARMENALLAAGHHPFHVRRFACALLGVIDSGCGSARIRWDADTLWAEPSVGSDIAKESELFFDSIDRNETAFRLGVEAFASVPEMPEIIRGGNETTFVTDGKAGLFDIVKSPPTLVKSAVEEIMKSCAEKKWIALDAGCLRYVSPQAMACLYMMADERRRALEDKQNSGRFCITGMSRLNELIFRYWGMDSHIDLVSDIAGLDSLSRRLTSTSERSALLR